MSLGKIKTNVKTGIGQLQTSQGLKHMVVWLGIGAALGVIIDLVLEYLMRNYINGWLATQTYIPQRIDGIGIFPNSTFLSYDDLALLISTIVLLFTKRLWLVVGYFIGWYSSSYLGLYTAMGLPKPA